MNQRALIIGGDKRQEYLKNILDKDFTEVDHIRYPADVRRLDDIESYSHIILPIPLSKDGENVYSNNKLCLKIEDLIKFIKPCHKVYGTGFGNKALDYFEDKQIEYHDFMKDKIFKRGNAFLTAQGTLRLMLDNTDDYIVGKKALIIGFGDVAETLAEKLKSNGIEVYITARNKRKLSLAGFSGYKTIAMSSIRSCICLFDYIFGSVPANILDLGDIRNIKSECTYIELASPPYTAKEADFAENNIKYIDGSALPGRFLPLASGKLIADFILNNL